MQGTQIILLIYRLVDHAHKSILNILHLQPFTFDPNSDIIILLEMIIRLIIRWKFKQWIRRKQSICMILKI